jgi:hypothetical protein
VAILIEIRLAWAAVLTEQWWISKNGATSNTDHSHVCGSGALRVVPNRLVN